MYDNTEKKLSSLQILPSFFLVASLRPADNLSLIPFLPPFRASKAFLRVDGPSLFFFFFFFFFFFGRFEICSSSSFMDIPRQHPFFLFSSLFLSSLSGSRALAAVSALKNWWDDVNESEIAQQTAFYTLCAAYSIVGAVAVTQLVRIEMRVPECRWTTQKVFHLMNFIVNLARALVFGLYKNVFALNLKILIVVLLDFPGLLFFSTYTLLVLFWAEIYHQARSLPSDKLRPGFLVMNGVIYGIQIFIWLFEWYNYSRLIMAAARLFFAVVSFFAALGFALYGGSLFMMLRRFPLESKGRRKKLREVGFVTVICFTCFIVRTIVVAWSAFDDNVDLDVLEHPILNAIFYMLVEILPSALVLFILRKLPPKRVSAQYHPIR